MSREVPLNTPGECRGQCIPVRLSLLGKDDRRVVTVHETCLQEAETNSYELGQVVAKEALCRPLLERAGRAFADGKDEEAKLLRALAGEYERDAAAARDAWHVKHRKES